ncbi:MAG: hypothetical protein OEY29_07375 [Gammaproteobacteria bacterium]|nr:hypothetical protein [Gammaproteobacteria bacterium]
MLENIFKICITALLGFSVITTARADINTKIFEFQQKMAEKGNLNAQYKLGLMYEIGRGVARDAAKATLWYEKSSAKGYIASKHRLVYLGIKKRGFADKDRKWLTSLKKDAGKADGAVLYLLAELHETGTGFKKDLVQARKYYMQAKATGNLDAEARLFALESRINKNKLEQKKQQADELREKEAASQANKQNEEENRKRLEKSRLQEKEKKARERKAQAERKRLDDERKKLALEKQKLERQRRALEEQKAEAEKAAATNKETDKETDERFESDLCSGPAARFRTQCN